MSPIDDDAPPTDGADRVARAVGAFTAVNRGPGLLDADSDAARVSEPIPIYSIGPPRRDSNPHDLLKRAHRVGWRYLVFQGEEHHVADIKPGSGERPELIRSPDLVRQIVASGRFAEATTSSTSNYSVRLLDLSLLGQSVLWLVSSDPAARDRFFALSPVARELNADEFLGRMSNLEKQKAVTFDNHVDEAGG